MPRDKIFISYSHEDEEWLERLQTNLKPYLWAGSIKSWSDTQITSGSQWFEEIKSALTEAKVAVLLVTPNFLASDFIHEHELGPLLKEAEQGGVKILWVPISPSAYKRTPLKDYQAVLDPGTPLAKMTKAKRDEAWVKICEEIEKAVNPSIKLSPSQLDRLRNQVQDRIANKYIIKDIVASGKLAIIYRAERIHGKQKVAVKVLVASALDEGARKLFIDGATRAVELTSPAFIKILDHYMEESPEFLVSEFVEGEPLSSYLRRHLRRHPGGLPLAKVKSILLGLAEALVTPAGIKVGSNYLVDAGRRFALDFELGGELCGEVFVEQLLAAIDLDAKQVAPYNRNDDALGDGLQKLVPLL